MKLYACSNRADFRYQISYQTQNWKSHENKPKIRKFSPTHLESLITFSCDVTDKNRPRSPHCWGFYISHTHTHKHTHTHNLLDHSERAIRPSQWPLPIHSTIWRIRNRDPYNRAVTDLIPRRHRHWQWHLIMCFSIFKYQESLNEGF